MWFFFSIFRSPCFPYLFKLCEIWFYYYFHSIRLAWEPWKEPAREKRAREDTYFSTKWKNRGDFQFLLLFPSRSRPCRKPFTLSNCEAIICLFRTSPSLSLSHTHTLPAYVWVLCVFSKRRLARAPIDRLIHWIADGVDDGWQRWKWNYC